MLDRVLGAPLSYFESTPMGRVLNRFTYDMEVGECAELGYRLQTKHFS